MNRDDMETIAVVGLATLIGYAIGRGHEKYEVKRIKRKNALTEEELDIAVKEILEE